MAGKMVVLKPVVWSPNGYRFPADIEKSGKDYVAMHGFGHEEWNGDPTRMWKGQRVFHTEVKGRMEDYGRRGELGIIMTAYSDKGPHAVGAATSVTYNTESERSTIAKAVKAAEHATEMWKLKSIQKRFDTFAEFKRFWEEESCDWIPWRCPPDQYEWFDKPIPLSPAKLFPPAAKGDKSPDIVKMFSTYMAITPDQALAVVWNSLEENSPIIDWLTSGTFDEVARKTKSYGKPIPTSGSKRNGSSPPATDPYVRYVQRQEITVTPRHHELQKLFKAHMETKGALKIRADQAGVDIQFRLDGHGHVLAEIKPCDKSDTRYAVRTAMGQLLDYQQRHTVKSAELLVVLEAKPSDEDIDLALTNGFGIAFKWGSGFVLRWPTTE